MPRTILAIPTGFELACFADCHASKMDTRNDKQNYEPNGFFGHTVRASQNEKLGLDFFAGREERKAAAGAPERFQVIAGASLGRQ